MCPDCGFEGDDAHLWCDRCGGLTSFSRDMVGDDDENTPVPFPVPPHDVIDAENMDFERWSFLFDGNGDDYEEYDGDDYADDDEGL